MCLWPWLCPWLQWGKGGYKLQYCPDTLVGSMESHELRWKSLSVGLELHLFHLFLNFTPSDGDWRLLHNLLMSSLYGAISAKQWDGVTVLVSKQLHLQVTCLLRQFHYENWWTRNFCLNLTRTKPVHTWHTHLKWDRTKIIKILFHKNIKLEIQIK